MTEALGPAARAGVPATAAELQASLRGVGYLAGDDLAMAAFLALRLGRPLLLEGENGVGKTEIAHAFSRLLGRELVRLQCYEGIDASQALYDWHYPRQLLAVREGQGHRDVFTREFLVARPLLRALEQGAGAVLLIDELDRADDEFEAFLLELLSDFAVTIPEVGQVRAAEPPLVILTSNRTRELHNAVRRRCLYSWVAHPDPERELEILRLRAPEVPEPLAVEVSDAVARIRGLDLAHRPGVGEALDWASALHMLDVMSLDRETARSTLAALVKDVDDQQTVLDNLESVLPAET
ncbi:AAA family ATPase [Georgenia thermotolerans]|uniref:AAA domain-containing protein n=1 Tax=Georgenia thermotolerans TaxID=527326 RepID=A0A7J5UUF6_9MICO|nr:MoxR family ATPase [Georgenia thermotolerans]KAE8765908.1 AAA domain-containing protein [Georgenia thermotolerans]